MSMPRLVEPETLDGLSPDDPAAVRSRRDLKRVHRAMGTRTILRRALLDLCGPRPAAAPLRVLELGAGDGSLMLGVARALGPAWARVELTLLDRQPIVARATLEGYEKAGWRATAHVADVLDWARDAAPQGPGSDAAPQDRGSGDGPARWDLIVANLFLHHFQGPQLDALLRAAAEHGARFLACEPRRDRLALAGSHLIGALGVNAVTREDAVLSVRAGFRGDELTRAWPGRGDAWQIDEHAAGLFSHYFAARRLAGS